MPATYDITAHPLLSTEATALGDQLDAYAMAAETTLGLHETALAGDDLADAKVAIARQINRTLIWEKHQGVTSISKAGQSISYAGSGAPPVDRIAKMIADRLLGLRQGHGTTSLRIQPRL